MQPTNSGSLPRRRRYRDDMSVDLEAVRRDLLIAERPLIFIDLEKLASRARCNLLMKDWPCPGRARSSGSTAVAWLR